MEQWVDVRRAARALGISRSAVHRLIWRGTLAASWIGRTRVVHRDALERLIADPGYRLRTRRGSGPTNYLREELELNGQEVLDLMEEKGHVRRGGVK